MVRVAVLAGVPGLEVAAVIQALATAPVPGAAGVPAIKVIPLRPKAVAVDQV